MTDEDIIKALECCYKCTNAFICTESKCPLFGQSCLCILSKNALNLINRQKAEIERLRKRDETAEKIIREQADKIFNLQSENSRLTDRNIALSEKEDNSIIVCISARAEAVKEFSHFLIDKAEDGVISVAELPDLVVGFGEGRERNEMHWY